MAGAEAAGDAADDEHVVVISAVHVLPAALPASWPSLWRLAPSLLPASWPALWRPATTNS